MKLRMQGATIAWREWLGKGEGSGGYKSATLNSELRNKDDTRDSITT